MELFWYHVTEMDELTYQQALSMMSPARKKRVESIAADADKKRTAAAELLARRVLGEKLGLAPRDVPLCADENDKPMLTGNPHYLSMSHSGAWAVCAVDDKPVGVDAEVIRSVQEKFIGRVCSEQEQAYIRYGDDGCFQRFYECWTAKEAIFKLTGSGPLLHLSRFALPQDVSLTLYLQNGCAVSVAATL